MSDDQTQALDVKRAEIAQLAVKDIEQEMVNEEVAMVRDYVKGIMRFRRDKENQIKRLQDEIKDIDDVLNMVKDGKLEQAKNIKVPARYLDEKTVRMNGMAWEE